MEMKMNTLKEADLYMPIKAFFIENDYTVKGEVKDVDMVVSKDDSHIAIELKTSFNLKLVLQAVERQKYFDSVYVAIFKPKGKNRRYREIIHLLKRLEVGLITVESLKQGMKVHIEHHPIAFNRSKNKRKEKAIIKEIITRTGVEDNIGGSTKVKRMTAYREASLLTAVVLADFECASPKEIKKISNLDKTGQILYQNHYKWFDRIGQGKYQLNTLGYTALNTYTETVEYFRNDLKRKGTLDESTK